MTSLTPVASTSPAPADLPANSIQTYSRPAQIAASVAKAPSAPLPSWVLDLPTEDRVQTKSMPGRGLEGAAPISQGFRLNQMVGSGGMGEVWSALQGTLQRPVAVKRLRYEVLGPNVADLAMREFRLEAMVAGRLEHPNIVPIHDLGADEKGRPLIAMKLVEGETWSEVIHEDWDILGPPEFLAKHLPILLSMANAVAFAHDRGVVHRDLKPSQVMVGSFGEVMLMDWGLAMAWKVTERPSAPPLPLPLPEQAGNPAGTPALMAPEQTHDNALTVGPHTDVFLLGGTLYFLLTGTYPYQAGTTQASFLKARVADLDRPEVRLPDRWIPKELADVAMRAMSANPADRYASATQFRTAVNDWITGAAQRREAQALMAQAESALNAAPSTYAGFNAILHELERVRGLWPDAPTAAALRQRALEGYALSALGAGDLTLAQIQAEHVEEPARRTALLGRINAAMKLAKRRERQRKWAIRATIALMTAVIVGGALFTRGLIETSNALAKQRDRADAARADAQDLVMYMTFELNSLLAPLNKLNLMDSVLAKLQAMLDRRANEDLTPQERQARISMMTSIAHVRRDQGRADLADGASQQVVREAEALLAIDAANPEHAAAAANAWMARSAFLNWTARFDEGAEASRNAIAFAKRAMESSDGRNMRRNYMIMLGNYGENLMMTEEFEEAAKILHETEMVAESLRPLENNPAQYVFDMCEVWQRQSKLFDWQGKKVEAREKIVAAAKLAEDFVAQGGPHVAEILPNLQDRYYDVASLSYNQERADEAEQYSRKALAVLEDLIASDPTNFGWRDRQAAAFILLSSALEMQARFPEAMDYAKQGKEARVHIATRPGASIEWRAKVADACQMVALLAMRLGDLDEAKTQLLEATDLLDRLLQEDPTRKNTILTAGEVWDAVGKTLTERGEVPEAKSAFERSLSIRRRGLELDPTSDRMLEQVCWSLESIGEFAMRTDQVELLGEAAGEFVEIQGSLTERRPTSTKQRERLAYAHHMLASWHHKEQRAEEAIEHFTQMQAMMEALIAEDENNASAHRGAGTAHSELGKVFEELGRFEAALQEYRKFLATSTILSQRDTTTATWKRDMGIAHRRIGSLLMKQGKLSEAEPHLRLAVELIDQFTAPNDAARPVAASAMKELEDKLAAQQ